MRIEEQKRELRRRTAQAAAHYRARSGEGGSSAGAAPGDVLLLGDAGGPQVLWLVVDGDGEGRWLVMPGDTNPLLGRADVALSRGSDCDLLRLRCALRSWVGTDRLAGARGRGRVSELDLVRVRRRWRALEEESPAEPIGAGDRAEADADPEYQDWIRDVVRPARQALVEGATGEPLPGPAAGWWRRTGLDRPRRRALPWRRALAATLFLALSAGLLWQGLELRRLGRQRDAPQVNLPFVWLTEAGTQRGGAGNHLSLPAAAQAFILVLEVDPGPADRRYRMEISEAGGSTPVWSRGDLARTGEVELVVVMPRRVLPPGTYLVRLGQEPPGEGSRPIAEYRLQVTAASPR